MDLFDQESEVPNRESGKLYQDQIYGAKTLSPLAVAVIDSPEFQRLGGLRQLGFSDVVYRGARHSRLEHSIGTYLICRQIMRRIVQNHERLNLEHPGKHVSAKYRQFPANSELDPTTNSLQARWRGLMEVVSVAALVHDIGHVPFGHTLEDEFTGIFLRHDRLAGPRLFEMLFSESSTLAKVFSDSPPWLTGITNEEIRQLIYVILNWKEKIEPLQNFESILKDEIDAAQARKGAGDSHLKRLRKLEHWYAEFSKGDEPLFQPFMSDIIGNTICGDLLDYLPRDRKNLGMEARHHDRLQRYFTIRPGTLHQNEGLRMSIMVTRKGRGGQRRDVASAVLDIMRERFEMAEAVFYHHKKAAASAMLAKLAELAEMVEQDSAKSETPLRVKPRDDEAIYPAPWSEPPLDGNAPPHMTHLSDAELIEYLGSKLTVTLRDKKQEAYYRELQRRLFLSLRYRRREMYRTLLVIDVDLVGASTHPISHFIRKWRGEKGTPDNSGRREIEAMLAEAGGAKDGEVILYCPDSDMQSKEIDARLEIQEKKILPLRVQDSFVYKRDIETLQHYYKSLWRAYLFVAPNVFADKLRCRKIVDAFCSELAVDRQEAYKKVRGHNFDDRVATVPERMPPAEIESAELTEEFIFSRLKPALGENADDEKAVREYVPSFLRRLSGRKGPERARIVAEVIEILEEGAREAPLLLNRFDFKRFKQQFERLLRRKHGGEAE
jgi:HD superfamily phosphohydrolase